MSVRGSTGDPKLDEQIETLLKHTALVMSDSLAVLPEATLGITVSLLASVPSERRERTRRSALASSGLEAADAFDALFAAADTLRSKVHRSLNEQKRKGAT